MYQTDLTDRRVVVLSDNDTLTSAIELDLCHELNINPIDPASTVGDDLDLIIVAISSPTSELVNMLFRASLLNHVGWIPLLVVSERPFNADEQNKIVHLNFPFDLDELARTARDILQKTSRVERELVAG